MHACSYVDMYVPGIYACIINMHLLLMWGPYYMYVCAFLDAATSHLCLFCFGICLLRITVLSINTMYVETIVTTSTRACPRWGRSRNEGGGVALHSATTGHIGARPGHVRCKACEL